jgi:hypothetical protein
MLNEVGRSPLVSGFFWDDVWNPGCNIHDQVTAQSARVASVASPVLAAIAQASSRELVATVQVGNTCIDMGFNCTAPKVDGLGVRDGRNAPASCDDPRLTQMTVDYQKNMKALREAALNAGKFVSILHSTGCFRWLGCHKVHLSFVSRRPGKCYGQAVTKIRSAPVVLPRLVSCQSQLQQQLQIKRNN